MKIGPFLRFGMKLGVLSLIVDTKLPLKDRAYTKLYNYDQLVTSGKRTFSVKYSFLTENDYLDWNFKCINVKSVSRILRVGHKCKLLS